MNRTAEVLLGALATALLCTIWMFFANHTGLLGWGGFAGCTAYFAAPKKGLRGLPVLLACVASGMLYAFCCLYLGKYFPDETIGLASTCIITFLMCAGGKFRLLAFVPGAFIGSFSSFAAGGDPMVIPSILAGLLLGLTCDTSGRWLCRVFLKDRTSRAKRTEAPPLPAFFPESEPDGYGVQPRPSGFFLSAFVPPVSPGKFLR